MKCLSAILLTAAILISILSGCSQDSSGTEPSAKPTGATEATTYTEPTGATEATTSTEPPAETKPGTEDNFRAADLVIHEIMPNNRNLILGHELDWIELYNREDTAVNLDGYCLTDSLDTPQAMPLTGLEIPAGGFLVVPLKEDAAFHLAKEGETVYLTCRGEVVSQLAYELAENGESFGSEGVCQYPTPGAANTQEGYLAYLNAQPLPELMISEVMPSNSKYLPIKGECYDWVEVQNTSSVSLNLKLYYLADKRDGSENYYFPDITLAPGECFVVYCSGATTLGGNHAPFKISKSGETVYLGKGDKRIDAMVIPGDLQQNESYGRSGKIPSYLKTPSPNQANGEGYLSGLAAPAADVASGHYPQPILVTLSGEGTIYYTMDGSRPTAASAVYTQPISINGVTTLRTFSISGERSSQMSAYTYTVGVTHDLPVVCVAIPQVSLTGDAGVLNHPEQNYEYEAMLTLIENGEEQFSVPFGFRLHGNDSRKCPKQNFSLRFRSEYGAGKLNYRLFEDRNIDSFDSLLLKGGSEDWGRAVMRDEISTSVANGTTAVYTQAMKPVVLYLGGEYWGVYYLKERFSDEYVASHLQVSPESVDLVQSTNAYTEKGSNEDFLALISYVKSHDMRLPENYRYLTDRIDVISLMDWYICRGYSEDVDLANIRRFRSKEADGKWRWMYYDLDWGFGTSHDVAISGIIKRVNGDPQLIRAVLKSEEGKAAFLQRCAYLLNTVLTEKRFLTIIDDLAAAIESEMPRDRERWGRTVASWQEHVQQLRDFVKDGARNKRILEDLRSYFSLTDAQMESYFGS